jgi:TusA-related sulfurtransferase
MMARALTQRWPISDKVRKAIVGRLVQVVTDPQSSPREVTSAAKALMAAEAQNQADEHKLVDVILSTRNDRLDAIAADLGIDQGLIESIARETGGSDSGDEAVRATQANQ